MLAVDRVKMRGLMLTIEHGNCNSQELEDFRHCRFDFDFNLRSLVIVTGRWTVADASDTKMVLLGRGLTEHREVDSAMAVHSMGMAQGYIVA